MSQQEGPGVSASWCASIYQKTILCQIFGSSPHILNVGDTFLSLVLDNTFHTKKLELLSHHTLKHLASLPEFAKH